MRLNLLIILGTCLAVVVLGLFGYWIIIKFKKTLRTKRSNSQKRERQISLSPSEDIDYPSLDQTLNKTDNTPDIPGETGKEDNDWLNNGVPEASASTIKKEDDDWLTAGAEEVPADSNKAQDDKWLNEANNQSWEIGDETSLDLATSNRPEIHIKQAGSILNITITDSKKPEQTLINLKINVPHPYFARKAEGPFDIEITADEPSPSYQDWPDSLTVEPIEGPVNPSQPPIDEISVIPPSGLVNVSTQLMDDLYIKPFENQVTENQPLMDVISVIPSSGPVIVSTQLVDDLYIKPFENQVTENQPLMDVISVMPSSGPVIVSMQPMDDLYIKPFENQVTENQPLMDLISVMPSSGPVIVSTQMMDDLFIKPVENRVSESQTLMDVIYIKPSPGPVNIEYELLDDLITKSALYKTKKVKPINEFAAAKTMESAFQKAEPVKAVSVSEIKEILKEKRNIKRATIPATAAETQSTPLLARVAEGLGNLASRANNLYKNADLQGTGIKALATLRTYINKRVTYRTRRAKLPGEAVITKPVEFPVEKAEPVKTFKVNENTQILNEKKDFNQAAIPATAAEIQGTPLPSYRDEVTGKLSSQTERRYRKADVRIAVTKALATLRIYNNNGFYIQDTNLTQIDISLQNPQIKGFTFKVLNTATELDELINGGYDLVIDFSKIKLGLKKGMVVFIILVERELASIGWVCMNEESKATFRGYPYNKDLDKQACIVGDWTNPKYQDSEFSTYIKYKRQELLKEKGFTFERSIVEESRGKDLNSMRAQKKFELTYKLRTYTNVALPGILGMEFWKEHPLNETDTNPPYKMMTLLVLVLPSPPTGCLFEPNT
jgi:hypothetical protein